MYLTDPEQAGEPLVDLIDEGQVFVAFGVLISSTADGTDRCQSAMLQTPGDHRFHGVAHFCPRKCGRTRRFPSRKLARPAGQKQHIGSGQLVLPIAPGNLLDHHTTLPAVDASHAGEKENQKAPQRNELEAAFGEMIVPRRRSVAPGTDGCRSLPRSDIHFDAFVVGSKAGVLVDKNPR